MGRISFSSGGSHNARTLRGFVHNNLLRRLDDLNLHIELGKIQNPTGVRAVELGEL